jgi:hypothetical protein
MVGLKKQHATVNEGSLQSNWALFDNPTTSQLIENNQIGEMNQQFIIS